MSARKKQQNKSPQDKALFSRLPLKASYVREDGYQWPENVDPRGWVRELVTCLSDEAIRVLADWWPELVSDRVEALRGAARRHDSFADELIAMMGGEAAIDKLRESKLSQSEGVSP